MGDWLVPHFPRRLGACSPTVPPTTESATVAVPRRMEPLMPPTMPGIGFMRLASSLALSALVTAPTTCRGRKSSSRAPQA